MSKKEADFTADSNSVARPLADLLVVEVEGRLSSRIAGTILAGLGARVLRVPVRSGGTGSPDDDAPIPDAQALAAALDHGKTTVAGSRAELFAGYGPADVLLTSGQDASLRDEWLPVLGEHAGVSVHLTPFGLDGPYAGMPGTELNLLSYGAIAAYVGDAQREPIAPPILLASYQAGVMAVIAALSAVRRSGVTRVDLAEADVLATNHVAGLYSLSALVGQVARRAGPRKPNPYPFTMLPCKDGSVSLVFLSGRQWAKFLKIMGSPEWSRDPRFADRRVNGVKHVAELDRLVGGWLRQYTKAQLRDIAVEHGIPIAPVQTIDDLLVDRQLATRGYFETARAGETAVKVPGLPFRLLALPAARANTRDAKGAGNAGDVESTEGAGNTAGAEGAEIPRQHRAARSQAAGAPLAGLRVLDLGWVLSGPMVGQTMADLGADVIKIESRSKLDTSRIGVPLLDIDPAADENGLLPNLMPHFNNVNRGKRSLALDLGSQAGKEVLARLVAEADMVIENFGAGSLERLGLPPDWFASIQPNVVLVRISICGQKGPESTLRGYAAQSTALGGLDALCSYRSESPVGLITLNLGDVSAALFAAAGALAALHRVDRGGAGSIVDTSMMESAAFHLGSMMAARQLHPDQAPPVNNDHAIYSPHGMFKTSDEDEWISIAVRSDTEWQALHGLIGAPAQARGWTAQQRRARREEIAGWITAWTGARGMDPAFQELRSAGIAAAPAYAIEGLLADPHARARGSVVEVDHHILGALPIYGTPLRAAPSIASARVRAPDLGEHSMEVLAELGMSEADLDRLAAQGAFDGMDIRQQAAQGAGE